MLAPEEPELYNTKAALEGWVSNLWCAKSYRRHSPKPQKSPTALVMDSNGRAWLYCTCELRTCYRDHLESGWMNPSGVAHRSVQHLDCHARGHADSIYAARAGFCREEVEAGAGLSSIIRPSASSNISSLTTASIALHSSPASSKLCCTSSHARQARPRVIFRMKAIASVVRRSITRGLPRMRSSGSIG